MQAATARLLFRPRVGALEKPGGLACLNVLWVDVAKGADPGRYRRPALRPREPQRSFSNAQTLIHRNKQEALNGRTHHGGDPS